MWSPDFGIIRQEPWNIYDEHLTFESEIRLYKEPVNYPEEKTDILKVKNAGEEIV